MQLRDYLVGLGNVTLYKGDLGEPDRLMRVGTQAWSHGLMPMLDNPNVLISTLNERFQVEVVPPAPILGRPTGTESQMSLQVRKAAIPGVHLLVVFRAYTQG